MKKAIAIAVLVAGIAMSMTSVTAQSEEAEVNVSVATNTQLDVRPTELDYSGLEPGDRATSSDEANSYGTVEVENIGSTNITNLWAEASQVDSDPFGTGTASGYDAGNFVKISTSTVNTNSGDYGSFTNSLANGDAENYHYVNRVEFTDDPAPTYIKTLGDSETSSLDHTSNSISDDNLANHVGRFREGDEWFFYVVYYDNTGSTGACSTSNEGELWLGNQSHTPNSLGTTDFTSAGASNVETYDIQSTSSGSYGVTNSSVSYEVDGGSNTLNYDVFTYCDDNTQANSHTFRTKFNTDPNVTAQNEQPGQGPDASEDILSSATGEELNPGDYFPVDVTVELPQGVIEEEIDGGTLTILASI